MQSLSSGGFSTPAASNWGGMVDRSSTGQGIFPSLIERLSRVSVGYEGITGETAGC